MNKYKVKYWLQGEIEVEANTKHRARNFIKNELVKRFIDELKENTTGILIGTPKEVINAKE